MSFLLYRTRLTEGGREYYNPIRVTLAGGGLIQTTWKSMGKPHDGWTATNEQMLALSAYDNEESALIVDTSPSRDTINLFEIKAVSGFCHEWFTPIMITYECLFADWIIPVSISNDAQTFKQTFQDSNSDRNKVRSFLYLKGGWQGGDWNWGGNSRTTAALLWQEAWDYFRAT